MPDDTLHAPTPRDALATSSSAAPNRFATHNPMPPTVNPLAPPGGVRVPRWMRTSPQTAPAAQAVYCAIVLAFTSLMAWGIIRLVLT